MPASHSKRSKSLLARAAEWTTLALVLYSPWHYGSVDARAHLILHYFLLALSLLYALRIAADSTVKWINCPLGLLLALLLLWSMIQIVPVPEFALTLQGSYRTTLWRELIPVSPELLVGEEPVIPVPSATIAVDSFISRGFAQQILYLFLFYSILRNAIMSRSFLRLLAVVCLANVAIMSIVAMAVHFGPTPKKALGLLDVDVMPYGPFINRDHFAFYANLCLGLGLGLLSGSRRPDTNVYQQGKMEIHSLWDAVYNAVHTLFSILQSPRSFWVFGLSLIAVAGTILSQSRGSYIAALAGMVTCAFVRYRQKANRSVSYGLLFPFVVGFIGVAAVASFYLEKKVSNISLENWDNRSDLWRDTIKLLPLFGLAGSGGGTFVLVEPITRHPHISSIWLYDHAHNEYLEAVIEGGLPRLVLTLGLVGTALWFAARACRVHAGRSSMGLAYGCLYGLTATAVHSIGEFGVHVGSIALLLTLVAAGAASLSEDYDGNPRRFGSSRVMAWISAIAIPLLAGLLTWQAWKADSADEYRRLAEAERAGPFNATSLERRLAFSAAALSAEPTNPALLELRAECLADSANLLRSNPTKMREDIQSALALWIGSRNLSPLQPQPHARIGFYRDFLKRADPALTYFERAKRLIESDPQVWYICGLIYYQAGDYPQAWSNWRQALRLGAGESELILRKSRTKLSSEQLVELLIPEDLYIIRMALDVLYPDRQLQRAERRPLVAKAVEILKAGDDSNWSGDTLHNAGQYYAEFDMLDSAINAYRNALIKDTYNVSWRVELAQILRWQGKLELAREELSVAYTIDPKSDFTRYWLLLVEREIELRKSPDDLK